MAQECDMTPQLIRDSDVIEIIDDFEDYKYGDGNSMRDYTYISDIVDGIISCITVKIEKKSEIFNCGYGKGFSIMDVVNSMNNILKKKLPTIVGKPRKKDIQYSIANTKKFNRYFKWKPKYDNLTYILKTALKWEKKIIK